MTSVAIVTASKLLRNSIIDLIAADSELDVVDQTSSLEQLTDRGWRSDVILLAHDAPGTEITNWIDSNTPPEAHGILVLGADAGLGRLLANAEVEAWGLLDSDADADEILAAVLAIASGLIVISPDYEAVFKDRDRRTVVSNTDSLAAIEPLTARETEVLEHLAMGRSNRQIASLLTISTHTVKFHISSVYGKLGAANRAEAVKIGLQQGYLSL